MVWRGWTEAGLEFLAVAGIQAPHEQGRILAMATWERGRRDRPYRGWLSVDSGSIFWPGRLGGGLS